MLEYIGFEKLLKPNVKKVECYVEKEGISLWYMTIDSNVIDKDKLELIKDINTVTKVPEKKFNIINNTIKIDIGGNFFNKGLASSRVAAGDLRFYIKKQLG